MTKSKAVVLGLSLLLLAALAGFLAWSGVRPERNAAAGVRIPVLSAQARAGQSAYDTHCANCHGPSALGSDKGPPFLHPIYIPDHHSDASFLRAVRQGVRQHHWRFGDMPAQPQVSERELAAIVRYVRELQQANGIGPAAMASNGH